MNYSATNISLWSLIIQVGLIALFLLLANTLRRKIPFFKKSLMPTAVLAGFLFLILRTLAAKLIAPEAFEGLPAPTNVFIGGSGGRLSEILAALEKKTKRCRVVITAVTTETLRELVRLTDRYGDSSLVELRATRLRVAGAHHLFRAENPVYVAAFTMDGEP